VKRSVSIGLLGFLCACEHIHPELTALTSQIKTLQAKQQQQDEDILRVEQNMALRACGQVLKDMLDRIRMECHSGAASTPSSNLGPTQSVLGALPRPAPAVAAASDSGPACTSAETVAAVAYAKRELGKSSVGETIYAAFGQRVVMYIDEGHRVLSPSRTNELKSLVDPDALLHTTRFLIVTSPRPGEAEAKRRLELVREIMLRFGVRSDRIDPPSGWQFDLQIPRARLRGPERPEPPEPEKPDRAVWVFRTDC
jgi:hypothetical protein